MAKFKGRLTTRIKTAQGVLWNRSSAWETLVASLAQQISQLSEASELPSLLQSTVGQVQRQMGCDRVLIYQFEANGRGHVVAESVSEGQWSLRHRRQDAPAVETLGVKVDRPGWVSIISDATLATLSPDYRDWLAQGQTKASLGVAIQDANRRWGLLIAQHCCAPRPWHDREIQGLQRVAVQLCLALRHVDLITQLQTSHAKLADLPRQPIPPPKPVDQRLPTALPPPADQSTSLIQQPPFWRQLLDSLLTFVVVLTPDGILIETNQVPLAMAGLQREDVVGRPFASAYWWAYAATAQAQIQAAIAQASLGTTVRFDIPVQGREGEPSILDFCLMPLRDGRGQIVYLVASGHDITHYKQAETALRHSQSQRLKLAAIVESSKDAIISKTLDGTITTWNAAAERLFGYTAPEIIGQPITTLIPPDRQAEEAMIIQRIYRGEQVKNYDTQRRHKDGTLVDVALTISPLFDEVGQVIGASKIVRNISERKAKEQQLAASEARFQKLADTLPGVLYTALQQSDGAMQITYISSLARELFELEVTAILQDSRAIAHLFHPDDWAGYEAAKAKSAATLTPLRHEWRIVTPSGKTKWVQANARPEKLTEQTIQWFGVLVEITDRKQAEIALQQSEATNRALIAAIPDFLVRMRQDGLQLQMLNQGAIHAMCSKSDFQAHHISDLMPAAIAQERVQLAQKAIATGQMQEQEYEFIDQGQVYYEEARILPLWQNEVLVVVRDITPRKQAELALSQAKEQLELVLQASSEGFSDWDVITNTIYFSPRWKSILGYADHELENSLEMWNTLIFPDDREATWQLLEAYNSGQVKQVSIVQRYRHKNGAVVHILTRIIHLKDAQGQVVRMVGSHLDVTVMVEMQKALQTSEMQLSSVLNSSLDGIMAFRSIRDAQGTIIDFEYLLINPTASKLAGRTAADLIGKRLLEEMPGQRESGLFADYVQVVETGEPHQREFYYCHDDLESWFENIAVKLGDGFAVTCRDVTNLKQSEQALQQANQLLEDRVADLDQRHAEMLLLSEMSDFLQACLTVEEACTALGSLVEPLFPGCGGGLFLTHASRSQVSQVSQWGPNSDAVVDFHPHDCWALRRGRLHSWSTDQTGLRCQHVPAAAALASTLCIPMLAQGETLGLFYLTADQRPSLSAAKQQLARTVAEQIGLAIANLELRETLLHQSIRDPLTGLFNRRYLEESLSQEIIRAQRYQESIGIIMLDVDHFKRFNDTYGHDAGDHVLQIVSTLLQNSVRGSDIVCRYGGEEMTLILPGLSLEQTTLKAEAIRESLANLLLTYNDQYLGSITASLGVASFPNHGATSAILIQTADAALYRAKAAGRDQVMIAPPTKPP